MYFIVVKFKTKPEWTEKFVELVTPFTTATRAEPGNLWFEWSRSIDEPDTFVLVEAFADDDAAGAHVNSEHFATATRETCRRRWSPPRRSSAARSTARAGMRWARSPSPERLAGSLIYDAATDAAVNMSIGIGYRSFQMIPMGRSPV